MKMSVMYFSYFQIPCILCESGSRFTFPLEYIIKLSEQSDTIRCPNHDDAIPIKVLVSIIQQIVCKLLIQSEIITNKFVSNSGVDPNYNNAVPDKILVSRKQQIVC